MPRRFVRSARAPSSSASSSAPALAWSDAALVAFAMAVWLLLPLLGLVLQAALQGA
jgi:hypothetical protein